MLSEQRKRVFSAEKTTYRKRTKFLGFSSLLAVLVTTLVGCGSSETGDMRDAKSRVTDTASNVGRFSGSSAPLANAVDPALSTPSPAQSSDAADRSAEETRRQDALRAEANKLAQAKEDRKFNAQMTEREHQWKILESTLPIMAMTRGFMSKSTSSTPSPVADAKKAEEPSQEKKDKDAEKNNIKSEKPKVQLVKDSREKSKETEPLEKIKSVDCVVAGQQSAREVDDVIRLMEKYGPQDPGHPWFLN